jgi:hypothetical protein
MGYRHAPAVDRFAEKVALTDEGCLVWIASRNNKGYGTFAAGVGKSTVAHRWSYEHHIGPIAAGLSLDHLCRNRACVNPDHLEPVTQRDNLMRGDTIPARNASKTHCPAGHEYAGSNLKVHGANRHCRTCHNDRRRKAA